STNHGFQLHRLGWRLHSAGIIPAPRRGLRLKHVQEERPMVLRRFAVWSLALIPAIVGRVAAGAEEVVDPVRPVARITQSSVTLQYFTAEPCQTRVQIRRGDLPATVLKWRLGEDETSHVWARP